MILKTLNLTSIQRQDHESTLSRRCSQRWPETTLCARCGIYNSLRYKYHIAPEMLKYVSVILNVKQL